MTLPLAGAPCFIEMTDEERARWYKRDTDPAQFEEPGSIILHMKEATS